ncbi:MerR family DNA-binding transcriptional regulator [Streptomyces pharetrae]|uniref:MerR family DNA-binding transcriptional regulator n=1 Tax=Streptomyces pharetrae TaxID=291370 RepID=UPI003460E507
MRAGEAAAAAGVTIKALRYYEDCGLLHPAVRPTATATTARRTSGWGRRSAALGRSASVRWRPGRFSRPARGPRGRRPLRRVPGRLPAEDRGARSSPGWPLAGKS